MRAGYGGENRVQIGKLRPLLEGSDARVAQHLKEPRAADALGRAQFGKSRLGVA